MCMLSRQEYPYPRPFIGQMAGRGHRISAVVAAACYHAKAFALNCAQHLHDKFRRPPAGVFHQHDFRQAVSLCRFLVYPVHILYKSQLHLTSSTCYFSITH